MQGTFTEIITASMHWTRTMLFRPFRFKKWVMLAIIILLSFQMRGGCNSNINLPGPSDKETPKIEEEIKDPERVRPPGTRKTPEIAKKEEEPFPQPEEVLSVVKDTLRDPKVILIVIAAILFFLLIEWIHAVFSFIFIRSVSSNDASIKKPFTDNKSIATSYFSFKIVYNIIFFSLMIGLAVLGYFSLRRIGLFVGVPVVPADVGVGSIVLAVLPGVLGLIVLTIVGVLVTFFITDFVLVVMYKDRLPVLQAIPVAYKLLRSDTKTSVLYFFISVGLSIVTALLSGFIFFAIYMILLIPFGIIALLGYGLYQLIPPEGKIIYIVVGSFIGIILYLAFLIFMNMVYLPFAVFLKTFNLKFIARINERYNLFKITA